MNKRNQKKLIFILLAAIVIRVVLAVPLVHDWDGYVFKESAEQLIHGITPYQTVAQNPLNIYPDSDRPMIEQWYGYPPLPLLLFTPTYWIAKLLLPIIPDFLHQSVLNLGLKIPFIVGDLLCALLVKKYLDYWSEKAGNRAALLILFNPLLIWISSAWGMFDIWSVNFLLLYLLSVRSKKPVLAGVFLALSPQIKLFPLFFMPALFIFLFQKFKKLSSRIYAIWGFISITLIIDLPFFLSSPQGFLNQNLLMHMSRPSQGIGVVGMMDYIFHVYGLSIAPIVTLSSILTLGSVALFNLFAFVFIKAKENRLLLTVFLIYASTLVFNKVVNEQYFAVLIGLLIVLTHIPTGELSIFKRQFLVGYEMYITTSVLIASVVLGFHFLTFLPPFVSNDILHTSTNYLVFYFSRILPHIPLYTYPDSLFTYYNLPITLIFMILLPLYLLSLIAVGWGLVYFVARRKDVHALFSRLSSLWQLFSLKNISASIALIIIFVVGGKGLVTYLQAADALTVVNVVPESIGTTNQSHIQPKIGVFYNVWWNNPSHLPELADDAWKKTTLTPDIGYYTSKNSVYVRHIQEMKTAGIDFAVVSYHLYDRERYLTFSKYAEELGFIYTPMIESDDALSQKELRPLSPDGNPAIGYKLGTKSEEKMTTAIVSALTSVKDSQALFKIGGKQVVFIYDGHFYLPSWDEETKSLLAQYIYQKYSDGERNPFENISAAWDVPISSLEDIKAHYPSDIHMFNNINPDTYAVSNTDYKEAFLAAFSAYWKTIKSNVESQVGPIYLVSTYQTPLLFTGDSIIQPNDLPNVSAIDSEFYYSLSNTWSYWRNVNLPEITMNVWEKQEAEQSLRAKERNWPLFLTVTPTYNDTVIRGKLGFVIPEVVNNTNIYDWTWKTAVKHDPDYILIASWNEFFEGSAIEPSKEYGDKYLTITRKYTDEFKKINLAQTQ